MTTPKTKKQKNPVEELRTLINRSLSLLSFKQIHTVKDLCQILGIPYVKGLGDNVLLTHELIRRIGDQLRAELQAPQSAEDFRRPYNYRQIAQHSTVPLPKNIHDLIVRDIPKRNPKQKAELLYFQQHAAEELWYKILKEKAKGLLQWAETGDGKTYALGQVLRWLVDSGYTENKSLAPFKILFVTKASIVEQTSRVLRDQFGLDLIDDVMVVNYDALRAKLGKQFLEEVEMVRSGDSYTQWVWKKHIHPLVFIWDECQALKNENSEQSKIAQAVNDIKNPHILQIFTSATPFSRVAHAKCFAVSTKIPFTHGMGTTQLSNLLWPTFAQSLCPDPDHGPYSYHPPNIKRLMKRLAPYIVGFKNVRRKHKAIDKVELIPFDNPHDQKEYAEAWDTYLKRKLDIEGKDLSNSNFLVLVELQVFRQKAEMLRAPIIARKAWERSQEDKAVVIACCYKPTIAKVVSILYKDYNITRDQISLIWGGDDIFRSGTHAIKYSKEQVKQLLADARMGKEIDDKALKNIIKQITYEQAGLIDLPPMLDLGNQSREKRQQEIDKFQSGRSLFCLFTFQAGGAGLSLHHEHPQLRPRFSYVTPIYNEMEMRQALGRAPRITSLSDTEQRILLYKDTIEESVLGAYITKKRCLDVVVNQSKLDTIFHSEEAKAILGKIANEEEEEEITEEEFHEIIAEENI